MKLNKKLFLFSIAAFFLISCAENHPFSQQPQQPMSTPSPWALSEGAPPQLFTDAAGSGSNLQNTPGKGRYRFVHINIDLLLGEDGQILDLESGTEFTINLFPDVNYTGVIERTEQVRPESHSLIGHLKDIEYSSMYIVFAEGVFLMHFASPAGVYEVQQIQDGLYQVNEIAQSESPKD